MKKLLILISVLITLIFSVSATNSPIVHLIQSKKLHACYLCLQAGTYVIFEKPDTLEKRRDAYVKFGCAVLQTVDSCGFDGQKVLGKIK